MGRQERYFHRIPTPLERPKARPQENRGTDHRHSLYRYRGYRSSTRVGSVAPLGNTKEDEYYRNDSLKYCRHEEKKRKENLERPAAWRCLYRHPKVVHARLQKKVGTTV
ncbi:hypothetical protein QBC35DRAFT_513788 [Podospora australis]|uniref:Uncharacterized protein n=1 Tax=Podospora australis TaxID=1536484 RepID=A0AAN6WXC5_9PEZI|nr:hypothetical protein QBC35DRAFT_513788 [Podospora australis]